MSKEGSEEEGQALLREVYTNLVQEGKRGGSRFPRS